jgi:arylsulfatase A-like enzyme
MLRNTRVQMAAVLAVGLLLGYVVASGRVNPFQSANAAAQAGAVKPAESDSGGQPACCDEVCKSQFLARADLKADKEGKQGEKSGKKPNIIVIMTDDTGWGDFNAYGFDRGVQTPNMNRVAAEGMRFTSWYGQASCTAGRASFITGRIPIRSGLSEVVVPGDPNHLRKSVPTVAEFFKKNGYQTYYSGKWHLGDTVEAMPINHGFDEMKHYLAYYAGMYAYTDPNLHPSFPRDNAEFMKEWYAVVNDGEWEGVAGQEPKRVVEHFNYDDLAEIDIKQANSAADYIKKHAKDDKPFFMFVAMIKVHEPTNPAKQFKHKSGMSLYLDSVMELDYTSGQIYDAIREQGLEKDTIVLWTADNGPWVDAYPDAGYSPFRGMKGTAFESGWRVPTFLWAPGRIKPGTVNHDIIGHIDAWPTLAGMAGLKPPPHGEWVDNNNNKIWFDGIDHSARLMGKSDKPARDSWIYIGGLRFEAVRFRDWKMHFTANDAWLGPKLELGMPAIYNLKMDPGESYDMTFNGAAPRNLGMISTSQGRWAGGDAGWTGGIFTQVIKENIDTFKKYPNIPTVLGGASIGSDLPQFVRPNIETGKWPPGENVPEHLGKMKDAKRPR